MQGGLSSWKLEPSFAKVLAINEPTPACPSFEIGLKPGANGERSSGGNGHATSPRFSEDSTADQLEVQGILDAVGAQLALALEASQEKLKAEHSRALQILNERLVKGWQLNSPRHGCANGSHAATKLSARCMEALEGSAEKIQQVNDDGARAGESWKPLPLPTGRARPSVLGAQAQYGRASANRRNELHDRDFARGVEDQDSDEPEPTPRTPTWPHRSAPSAPSAHEQKRARAKTTFSDDSVEIVAVEAVSSSSTTSDTQEEPGLGFGASKGFAAFTVLDAWRPQEEKSAVAQVRNMRTKQQLADKHNLELECLNQGREELMAMTCSTQEETGWGRRCQSVVMKPTSYQRNAWDFASLVLLIYEGITIPLQFFDLPANVIFKTIDWTSLIFWSLDMIQSLRTGYISANGDLVMQPSRILRHYVRTWLLLDILIVSLSWMEVVQEASSSADDVLQLGKASRFSRALRMVRLMRLLRVRKVVTLFIERIRSERLIIIADLAKIMVLCMGMSHLVACVWYGLANGQPEDEPSWIVRYMAENPRSHMTLGLRYFLSFHWAISQLTGGMDEIRPTNLQERIYGVVMFVVFFCLATLFVSRLTSSMTRLEIIASGQSKQITRLRRWLGESGISSPLAVRVLRCAQNVSQGYHQDMHAMIGQISRPLQMDVYFELHLPSLNIHPFFCRYAQESPQVMRQVCFRAVSELRLHRGDVVFYAGEEPEDPQMIILCKGSMSYVSGTDQNHQLVHEDMWVAEAALWTPWTHMGTLTVDSLECYLKLLNGAQFREIACRFAVQGGLSPLNYAQNFVQNLNMFNEKQTLTDLPYNNEEEAVCNAYADSNTMDGHLSTDSMGDHPPRKTARHTVMQAVNAFWKQAAAVSSSSFNHGH
eukprot:TRINITY_DN110714_c0_g1_i1.p1 TRINITY_DN110714_c0_g1~~TRINITY_DN110714_c0_g1_i1.p1  ORF type:complete len:882 (-),score=186.40 TRINITY_DN110714_c0_g1_i1:99-2744(-)